MTLGKKLLRTKRTINFAVFPGNAVLLVRMTEQNKSSCFKKSITPSTSQFVRQVWRSGKTDLATIKIYHGYFENRNHCYLNDFVRHCSVVPKNLTLEEILSIHKTNANMIDCSRSSIIDSDGDHEYKNVIESSVPEHRLSSSRCHTCRNNNEEDKSTAHLTDNFLDKFNIQPGQKKKRCQTYQMKSELLFHCLSYLIGTPQLVKLRQKLFSRNLENVHSSLQPDIKINFKLLSIGSKSEGLDMDGSDIDVLWYTYFARETTANDTGNRETRDFHFRYRSIEEGIYPGYVLLRYPNGVILKSCNLNKFQQHASRISNVIFETSTHGPASLKPSHRGNTDFVTSVKSLDWPEIANGWKGRQRSFGWPSQEMITNITAKGCHIVPVGNERNHDIDTDWRLSFCAAERELVWTFNHPQILIYGLLKLVLKEIINPSCLTKDLICSYFLKTVMFWVIEETSPTIWSTANMMYLFQINFNKLVQFVADDECPNYFIPSNNMLNDRISKVDRTNLLIILNDIANSGMAWMFQSKSLKPFANLFKANWTCGMIDINFARLKSFQKGKIGSYLFIQGLVTTYKEALSTLHHRNRKMKQVCKSIKPFVIKSKVLPFLAHFINGDSFIGDNKKSAALRTIYMELLVQEAFACCPFGKHMLAFHFYCEGRVCDCLRVLNSMLGCMDYCISHNAKKTSKYENLFRMPCAIIVKYFQHFYTSDIIVPYTSQFLTNELVMLIPFERWRQFILQHMEIANAVVYPETFVHFLRCLCHIQLGRDQDYSYAFQSLQNIQYVIQNDEYRLKDSDLWTVCYAFKKEGINLDYTNEANLMRYSLSHGMEPEFPHFSPSFGGIDQRITEYGFKSCSFETLALLPSDLVQEYRESLSQVPKHVLYDSLSELPPIIRQAVNDLLFKL